MHNTWLLKTETNGHTESERLQNIQPVYISEQHVALMQTFYIIGTYVL